MLVQPFWPDPFSVFFCRRGCRARLVVVSCTTGQYLDIALPTGQYRIYFPGGSFDLRHRWDTSIYDLTILTYIELKHVLSMRTVCRRGECSELIAALSIKIWSDDPYLYWARACTVNVHCMQTWGIAMQWAYSYTKHILPISPPFEHCVLREIMRSSIYFAIVFCASGNSNKHL